MKNLHDLHRVSPSDLAPASLAALDQHMMGLLHGSPVLGDLAQCPAVTAAQYHLCTGGQRVRAVLALHAGTCLGLTPENTMALAATCELLHNASLIHDDLHDRDTHRRNQPSVWHKFGDEVAVCAGDLMISASYLALSKLVSVPRMPQLFALMHARIASAIRGQCADLSKDPNMRLTIEDFKQIARAKSGALLSLPTELALMAAEQDAALVCAREAALSFAVAYQIHDDLLDAEADAARNLVKPIAHCQTVDRSAYNSVLILQSDPHCADARSEVKKIARQHLLLASSACTRLPFHAGDALHTLCVHLQDELECSE